MVNAKSQWAVACLRTVISMYRPTMYKKTFSKSTLCKSIVLCCLSMLGLTACSSAPRQVQASLPLVAATIQPLGQKLPAKYRSQLEQADSTQLDNSDYSIQLGARYTSSLGQDCRDLTIYDQAGDKSQRVACAEKKQYPEQIRAWYLVPNIVQHASSIKL